MSLDKRLDRVQKLGDELGVSVYYPLANSTSITLIDTDGELYEIPTLRKAEACLRDLKRRKRAVRK